MPSILLQSNGNAGRGALTPCTYCGGWQRMGVGFVDLALCADATLFKRFATLVKPEVVLLCLESCLLTLYVWTFLEMPNAINAALCSH